MGAIEFVIRLSIIAALALLADFTLSQHPRARRNLWSICCLLPITLLFPLPKLLLPLLSNPAKDSAAINPSEVEIPALTANSVTYAADPGLPTTLLILIGACCLGIGWFVFRLLATVRIIRGADQVDDARSLDLLLELSHQNGLDDVPLLKRSDQVRSPFVFGILQPIIVLPTSPTHKESALPLILEHELVHLKQGDVLRQLVFNLFRFAFWWNPLTYFAHRQAMLSMEQVVDQSLKDRPAYAELLASMASAAASPSWVKLAGSGNLLKRIRTLTDVPPQRRHFTSYGLVPLFPITMFGQLVEPYDPDPNVIGTDEIVCIARSEGVSRLVRLSIDFRNQLLLPPHFNEVGGPSVSPDGRWIAYSRIVRGQEDLYLARVTGEGERLLASSPFREVQPRWSPDGRSILYSTQQTGNWEVAHIDVVSRRSRLLTQDGKINLEPSWHPSGTGFVFSSHRTGHQKLWWMKVDGSEIRQLTFGDWMDTRGRFSPDGRLLAFSSARRLRNESTLLDLRTGKFQPLVSLNQLDTGEVEFIDNGQSVAMTSWEVRKPRIAKVSLKDFDFTVAAASSDMLWPASR